MRESVLEGADVDICERGRLLMLPSLSVVSYVPNRMGRQGRVIQVHSHSLLLRTLAGEGVDGGWLRHLRGAFENLLSALVDSGNTDNKVAMAHSGVFNINCEREGFGSDVR